MKSELLNLTMNDGSRQFAEISETVFFDKLREFAKSLKGAKETDFITDWITEVWLDFEYRGNKFSINNQFGEYWFFVRNPICSDEILIEVYEHFRNLLEK
jgi:hypothetical protein